MEMLEESLREIRGQEIPKWMIRKSLNFIPAADYIPDLDQKMSAYRAVAATKSKRN